jgi:hypothetical protein
VYTCPIADEYISVNSWRMKPRRTSQDIMHSVTILSHSFTFVQLSQELQHLQKSILNVQSVIHFSLKLLFEAFFASVHI